MMQNHKTWERTAPSLPVIQNQAKKQQKRAVFACVLTRMNFLEACLCWEGKEWCLTTRNEFWCLPKEIGCVEFSAMYLAWKTNKPISFLNWGSPICWLRFHTCSVPPVSRGGIEPAWATCTHTHMIGIGLGKLVVAALPSPCSGLGIIILQSPHQSYRQ